MRILVTSGVGFIESNLIQLLERDRRVEDEMRTLTGNHWKGSTAIFEKTVKGYLENRFWWQNILSGDYQLQRQGLG